jgi:hypothetical protein
MKVELAGAAAFACLGLIAGALLRPQPADFRPDPAFATPGFTGPPAEGFGGADPSAGWGGRWGGFGSVPDHVVGTDSRQPPPLDVPPPPPWEEPAPEPEAAIERPPETVDMPETPPPAAAPAPGPAPGPALGPGPAPAPSPSGADRPKEGE